LLRETLISKSRGIQNAQPADSSLYKTWVDGDQKSINTACAALNNPTTEHAIYHSQAATYYRNIEPNTSVRTGFNRESYERFRMGEAMPWRDHDIILSCMSAYHKTGIVRNIIDLMGDFACQGITLVHTDPKIQNFYRNWFKKVNGPERSERFLNLFYRCGNVIVRRGTATLNVGDKRKMRARADVVTNLEDVNQIDVPKEYVVPWTYTFFNPLNVEMLGGELAAFVGARLMGLKIPPALCNLINRPKPEFKYLIDKLPKDIIEAVKAPTKMVILPPDRTFVYFYKKDDWEIWAKPMVFSVLEDLILYEKMKLADLTALDGVISNVRIWKLGDLEHKLMPTYAAIDKLSGILANNVGGGTIDIIWGPELSFEQHIPDVSKVLGSEKYVSVLNAIKDGLGIPSTLTGGKDSLNAAFFGLKTLIERLEYGRKALNTFWEQEVKEVQRIMGFKDPPTIQYSQMSFSDEAAEKALLIQLADRNLLSWETLTDRFGEDPVIEEARLINEKKMRKQGGLPNKGGPFDSPLMDEENEQRLKEIALQNGLVNPSEVGLKLDENTEGPRPVELEQKGTTDKPVAPSGKNGRPKFKKDTKPRDKRTHKKDISKAALDTFVWTRDTQELVSAAITPKYLEMVEKRNVRSLTEKEFADLELVKFNVLSNLEPYIRPTETDIFTAVAKPAQPEITKLLEEVYLDFKDNKGQEPTADENRTLMALALTMYLSGDDD